MIQKSKTYYIKQRRLVGKHQIKNSCILKFPKKEKKKKKLVRKRDDVLYPSFFLRYSKGGKINN